MEKIIRKRNILKNMCMLVTISVLIGCSLSAPITAINKSDRHIQKNLSEKGASQFLSETNFLLLDENFTDGNMPPTGDAGDWSLQQTNSDETWYIDSSVPYTEPFCGTIHREDSDDVQDEWLITPSLNFNNYPNYTAISLNFHWYTCYFTTVFKRYVEFNVSISTNGGANWTNIWSFDDMSMGVPPNPFTDWKWYNTNYLDQSPIDLSDYIGQNNVKIAFQYYSNTTASADVQEFSIDDIEVIAEGTGTNFTCNAGGPYSWWWPMQYEYFPNGVRFHGNVTNGTVFTQYLWDFGDGNTSISIPLNADPVHFYNDVGTFNVTLTAKDTTFTPTRIASSTTTVTLFLLKPPQINITAPLFSMGIKATINNVGDYDCVLVRCWINVSWGPLQLREKTVAQGIIVNLHAGSSTTIQSQGYFFGMGRIHIMITVYPENQPGLIKSFNGFKIGPFVIITSEG
ncbi:MAG TPA: PKD domain-containing protein [Thermoplasmata archaeon]|nr:PKD domain-containing protein [Thermoplasmata archaeon]